MSPGKKKWLVPLAVGGLGLVLSVRVEEPAPPEPPPALAEAPPPPAPRVKAEDRRTGQQALRRRLPVMPGGGELVSIGEQQVAYGLPMNLAAFETTANAIDVLKFYAAHFDRARLPWQGPRRNATVVPYPALSATDLDQDVQLSVLVLPHDDDEGSTVVLSLADMRYVDSFGTEQGTGDLPRYPGTRPTALISTDELRRSISVSFDTADGAEKVAAFYRERLAGMGYRERGGEALQPVRELAFAKGEQGWTLALTRHEGRTVVVATSSAPQEVGR